MAIRQKKNMSLADYIKRFNEKSLNIWDLQKML